MNADGSGLRRLTTLGGMQEEPAWSPDGRRIAFSLVLPTKTGCAFPELYSVRHDGSGLRRLTRNRVADGEPAWSSTGRLAFTRWLSETNSEIYVIEPSGQVHRLTQTPAGERDPAWSADGRTIGFTRQASGPNAEIYRMNADGGICAG
jgi:TolB protein